MTYDKELLEYSRLVAGEVWRKWPTLDPDDIAQEIALYVLSTPSVLAEWQDYMEGSYEDPDQERHASNRMRYIARRAGGRYCRRELAAQIGYKPEDEAFYSVRALGDLVEVYYREGITAAPVIDRAGSTTGALLHSETYLASLLDVERGLKMLAQRYRARLKFRFKDMGDHDVKVIAAMVGNLAVAPGKRRRIERHLGTTESQIRGRIRQSLRKLQEKLGGPSPYGKDDVELAA